MIDFFPLVKNSGADLKLFENFIFFKGGKKKIRPIACNYFIMNQIKPVGVPITLNVQKKPILQIKLKEKKLKKLKRVRLGKGK